MRIRLYYNANCPDCVRQATRMDWLDRVALVLMSWFKRRIVIMDYQSLRRITVFGIK